MGSPAYLPVRLRVLCLVVFASSLLPTIFDARSRGHVLHRRALIGSIERAWYIRTCRRGSRNLPDRGYQSPHCMIPPPTNTTTTTTTTTPPRKKTAAASSREVQNNPAHRRSHSHTQSGGWSSPGLILHNGQLRGARGGWLWLLCPRYRGFACDCCS